MSQLTLNIAAVKAAAQPPATLPAVSTYMQDQRRARRRTLALRLAKGVGLFALAAAAWLSLPAESADLHWRVYVPADSDAILDGLASRNDPRADVAGNCRQAWELTGIEAARLPCWRVAIATGVLAIEWRDAADTGAVEALAGGLL